MRIIGFILAVAASAISCIVSFIPIQLNNILIGLFLVFLSVMCYRMPERHSLKLCLAGSSVLFVILRFIYMSTLGKIIYIILALAVIAGAALMYIGSETNGGVKA